MSKGKRRNYTEEKVLEAIKDSGGVVLTVAERLDCQWRTADNFIKKWESTKSAFEDEGVSIKDISEQKIISAIKYENDIQTAKWYLSKKAKERGYGDTLEIENKAEITKSNLERKIDEIEKSISFFFSAAEKVSPIHSRKKYIVENGGRAGGKSIQAADHTILVALKRQGGGSIICGREIQKSLETSSKSLIEERIRYWDAVDLFEILDKEIRVKHNGVIIYFVGLKEATKSDTIKSFNGLFFIWIEEAQAISEKTIEKLIPTINRNSGWQLLATMNRQFEDDSVIVELADKRKDDTLYIHINYTDNPFCPDDTKKEAEAMRQSDPERYSHIYLGEPERAGKDSLFPDNLLKMQTKIVSFERQNYSSVIIAVDPATTNADHSNEYGVVVMGLRPNGTADVIDDLSDNFPVSEFASTVAGAYETYGANACVIETNAGGDFVKSTILSACPYAHIIEVRATHDKVYRAQPIANFLSMGRLFFIKHLPTLKNQLSRMTRRGFIGHSGESPDRVDALAWGVYHLFGVSEIKEEGLYIRSEWLAKENDIKGETVLLFSEPLDCGILYIVNEKQIEIKDYTKGNVKDFFSRNLAESYRIIGDGYDELLREAEKTKVEVYEYHETKKELDEIVAIIRKGKIKIDELPEMVYNTESGNLYKKDLLTYDGKNAAPLLILTAYAAEWEGL